MATFDEIYAWSAKKAKKGSTVTVRMAAHRFKCAAHDIRWIVECACYPYLMIENDIFIFDGE